MSKPLNEILAKSINYGSLTLEEHTRQVVQAIALFAQKYVYHFDLDLAIKGAVLHDLGKAHPHFQRKIQAYNGKTLTENRKWDFIHRHEISSLGFLPIFPKAAWNTLIDLVVGHHKSIEHDAGERGIIDLAQNDREWKANHLMHWPDWHGYGLQILNKFGIATTPISYEAASQALDEVLEYCEGKSNGWSPWRGLLKSADHFASAFTHRTAEKLKPLFEVPDLSFYFGKKRKNDLFPLSLVSVDDSRSHTLVVAPTGAGKTDFLLKRCQGRIFYTLPFQASINAMYQRINATVPSGDIRLLHATSKIVARNRLDEQILQPLAGSSVKVLTPHQLAAVVFGTSGFESVMLDVEGTDIILDEIHTYSDFSRSMVIAIVKTLLDLGCRLHIGTATMPSVLYQELLKILGGTTQVYEVKLPGETLDQFNRHQVYKMEEETEVNPVLETAFAQQEKVLVIYNTVKEAQAAFQQFEEDFPNIPKMLIHSRFRRGDRVALEEQLTKDFNEKTEACLVVSTQVVEVSLDISFDRMITQCAPLDGLIQRFGRINRKRSPETIGKFKPVHVLAPKAKPLPYKVDVLRASFEQLPDNGAVLPERALQAKIDVVYPTLDMKPVDTHLIYKNGRFAIRELCNHKRAVLVEALEIESATCILESDKETYLTANWEDRLPLEIPIGYGTIRWHKNQYEQLEVGAYPFVIPQDAEVHKKVGLQFIEHDNFL